MLENIRKWLKDWITIAIVFVLAAVAIKVIFGVNLFSASIVWWIVGGGIFGLIIYEYDERKKNKK